MSISLIRCELTSSSNISNFLLFLTLGHSPIFEEFSLNAAAEGLFHPASTIEAFIEHDAKYNDKTNAKSSKPSSGRSSLSSRSGSRSSTVGEYLPSLENQKLPVLLNEKSKRVKLDSTSSSSSLLDSPGRGSSRNSTMGSTRSDSDLHAPRRSGAVPSSADRNALDFYNHEDGTDDDSEDDHLKIGGLRAKSSPPNLGNFFLSAKIDSIKSLGGSKSASTLSEPQQPDDRLLTKKFEDLKLLMSSKKKSKPLSNGIHQTETAPSTKTHSKMRESSLSTTTSATNSSNVRLTEKTAMISSRAAKPISSSTIKIVSEDRCHANATISVPIVVKTPPIKSKKDMKIRNGVSLSDLKEEHRAALEMLKELGGPVDTDYESEDPEGKTKAPPAKNHISSRSTKAKDTVVKVAPGTLSRSQKPSSTSGVGKPESSMSAVAMTSASPRGQKENSEPKPHSSSPMSFAGGSLVAKLRASIPSGRVKTPEPTEKAGADRAIQLLIPAECSMGEKAASLAPTALDGVQDAVISAALATAASFVLCRQERSLENVEEVDEEDDAELGNDIDAAIQHDGEPEVEQVKFDDSWRQYEDEEDADDDEEEADGDNEPLDNGGDDAFASEFNRSAPVTARSVDLYGDEGFESEW